MEKAIALLLLAVITGLLALVALLPIIPQSGEQFSQLAILGPNRVIGVYPTTVRIGEPFLLYVYVGNYQGSVQYYRVFIKAGNQSTMVSNSTAAPVPVVFSYSIVLDNNQNATFPISLSMDHSGLFQKLILELWAFNTIRSDFVYTGKWNQLWINVT